MKLTSLMHDASKLRLLESIFVRVYSFLFQTLPKFHHPYKFTGGHIYLDITESPMMLARVLGLYEVEKHKAISTFLKPGNVFIDVGANKGDFSLAAAKIVGESGEVIAFEPEPENFEWMMKSIEINEYKNICLYDIALSDRNSKARLYLSKTSGWHTLVPGQQSRDSGRINVKTQTLDNFLKNISFNRTIDVIKIDVEGSELKVLQGATETISNSRRLVLLIDIHPHLGVNPEEICYFLLEQDFEIFQEKPPFSSPITDYRFVTSIVAIKS